jgi:tryptophanyl-tRNA synthetase
MTDDEKFLWSGGKLSLEQTRAFTQSNARDILACGFDLERTFLFSNLDYMGTLYPNVCRLQSCMTLHDVKCVFGIHAAPDNKGHNIGQAAFTAIQAAPSFSSSFPALFGDRTHVPCLIPCAIDQVRREKAKR